MTFRPARHISGMVLAFLVLATCPGDVRAGVRTPRGQPSAQPSLSSQVAPQMSLITPGLMRVAIETGFFITIADEIDLSEQQQSSLRELFFGYQTRKTEILADLNVVQAEVERLLTRQPIALQAIRTKMEEAGRLSADMQMLGIESSLSVIEVLTHEQHIGIVALFREPPLPDGRVVR